VGVEELEERRGGDEVRVRGDVREQCLECLGALLYGFGGEDALVWERWECGFDGVESDVGLELLVEGVEVVVALECVGDARGCPFSQVGLHEEEVFGVFVDFQGVEDGDLHVESPIGR